MEFTEEEVRDKLKELGYINVPLNKLHAFMKDLYELIEEETNQSTSFNTQSKTFNDQSTTFNNESSSSESFYERPPLSNVSNVRPPRAFSKEKVPLSCSYISTDKENSVMEESTCSNDTTFSTRRKVARRRGSEFRVFDETLSETSEASDITALEDCLRDIPTTTTSSRSLPAFIRQQKPRTRKCDPVNRYHQFREEWRANQVPGEKTHARLRWNVRERMLQSEEIEKPVKLYQPNNYVVPTDKKRQSLRWKIRTQMAQID